MSFRFAGRAYAGFAGDTLASALLAAGVRLVARSFKLHRPRGVMAAGPEEPNALVDVLDPGGARRPNLRATEVEITDGLVAMPVNCWPSLAFDVGAANGLMARFIPVGFYYKTFLWPDWRLFEPFIRSAAGLGRAGRAPTAARFEHRFGHCDVLVAGGGRAGLSAALEAAAAGARVILCEQDFELGGRLTWNGAAPGGIDGQDWVAKAAATLRATPKVTVLTRTTVTGGFDHGGAVLMERMPDGGGRLWQVRATRLVLATGRTEQPLVFPGNDRPGVMLAAAAWQYQERFAVRLARRATVLTNNDAAYEAAIAFARRGAATTLVDLRCDPPASLLAALGGAGVAALIGAEVVATLGRSRLSAVMVRGPDGGVRRLGCDLLAISAGTSANLQLAAQAGGRATVDVVGSAAAGTESGETRRGIDAPGPAFVDFQNDVTMADIALAVREGFVQAEHLKRYTALGMGADQGKTSSLNGRQILAELTGRSPAAVGTPRPRFPVTPVPLGAFAGLARGPLLHPRRRTPLHALHGELGAVMDEYGGWMRPAWYPAAGETHASAERREVLAVRTAAGLFDASPLGKIEVVGPDAGLFLDRVCAGAMSSLAVGRARYGLMLNELGVIIDDGVTARLAEDRFLVTTTAAGAERTGAWLEEWRQCEWPDLRVLVAPVTTAWGVVTVSGPQARNVLRSVGGDIDLSSDAFPHMSVRQGHIAGVAARVLRVSFTGEVSYEINVPASHTAALWRALAAGGATPVGIEAWLLLRLEKGILHIGADTDGTTSPDDVGFGQAARRQADFVGKRSLSRTDNQRPDRHQLVGLETANPLAVGSHLVRPGRSGSEGYVTSAGFSPTLERPVSMAMVKGGRARLGETLRAVGGSAPQAARIVERGRYDPHGERLNE